MKKLWRFDKSLIGYSAVAAACFALAMVTGWTAFANRIDNYAYDWMTRLNAPAPAAVPPADSIILSIDDATLNAMGSIRNLRGILTRALEQLRAAQPKAVAIDLILTDPSDPVIDARLEHALAHTKHLVLATDWAEGAWENPLPQFRRWAAAVGHTLADQQSPDGVTRQIPLEEAENRERYWALSLEAFRIASGAPAIVESPRDLQIGTSLVPAKFSEGRPLWIRYAPAGIPQVSFKDLAARPELLSRFRGKVVFVGVYSNTAARDRAVTPYGSHVAGVEVNAQAFETLRRGNFLVSASNFAVLAFCAALAAAAGLIFGLFPGWPAYLAGAAALAVAHLAPFAAFRHGIVFPLFAPAACAWSAVLGAAVYQHFVVRRQLRISETERARYRQAIHFVTHEMRTPLTAIQGSSELMGRYNLNEEKRKQIASMINSESKRLARMIQSFLDVERLSDGQMELKPERFDLAGVVGTCLDRVHPLAELKKIGVRAGGDLGAQIGGDRELMEYAVYNLLTNAVKYSPPGTQIDVSGRINGGEFRLSVQDQGIGMDARELKKVFQKFYRTRRAEASGETGSGIGLSLVEQIVSHHGGRMEVTSAPGQGSCFTMVLPMAARDAAAPAMSS